VQKRRESSNARSRRCEASALRPLLRDACDATERSAGTDGARTLAFASAARASRTLGLRREHVCAAVSSALRRSPARDHLAKPRWWAVVRLGPMHCVERAGPRSCRAMDEETPMSPDELLQAWREQAALALYSYTRAGSRCRAWDTRLGGLIAVLMAVIGTSVFATLETKDVSLAPKIIVGLISVAAAVVAGIQTLATLSKRAFKYERAARTYGAIRREIEEIRCFWSTAPPSLKNALVGSPRSVRSLTGGS
jgi:hypothetical protein